MGSLIRQHYLAGLILLAFILLAISYSLVTPPFEAGDESRHFAVVKYMADTGRLPVQEPGEAQLHWSHEGNQPPLYYALAAALTFWIDTGDWDEVYWYNPHTSIGNPLRPDNKNITIHPPGERWPWRGHVLAVHLSRFLSIGMAAVTVMTAYAIALRLFTGNRWLAAGAMAVTAFNPMFIFISASVNNDNAVIMFVTLALGVMVQVAGDRAQVTGRRWQVTSGKWQVAGDRAQVTGRKAQQRFAGLYSPVGVAAILGLLIGLGALSKLYALGLIPLAGLLLVWVAYKDEQHRVDFRASRLALHVIAWSLTMLAVLLAIAGWFYARNAILYNGDVLALQIMRDTAGQRHEIPSLATFRAEFEGFRIAYWALFGGVNILADDWIYTVLDWVSLMAAIGVLGFLITDFGFWILPNNKSKIVNLKSKISRPTFLLLIGWAVIMMAGFILWNLTQPAGQGRLLYPAIAAISPLGMLGLTWWLPDHGRKIAAGLCIGGLFIFALISPWRYIAPAYARPSLLTEADLPSDLQPVDLTYDGTMRLIGYRLDADTVRPAQALPLSLYWELLQPVDLNYSIFVHLLGRQRQVVGQLDTYPGGGAWPTTLLKPGDIVADHYEIPVAPYTEVEHAPTRLLIAAGIYDLNEPGRPGKPATDVAGQAVEPIIARARLLPWQWPEPPRLDPPINFFDKATLLSYHIADDRQSVTLNWQADQPFEADYTVFIQAWRADSNEYAAGFDGPPVQGDYPTSLWGAGEIIVDTHPIDLAALSPGDYYLLAGLYEPATGQRLPAFGPAGPLPDYAVNLGTIQVTSSK